LEVGAQINETLEQRKELTNTFYQYSPTERLAEILQMLMDKYTFEDVDNSWLKLCYYYDDIKANSVK